MEHRPVEEKWNSVSHSVGFGLFLGLLLHAESFPVVLYCMGVCLTYFFSTFYHGLEKSTTKTVFRMLDMGSIYALIAISSASFILSSATPGLALGPALLGFLFLLSFYGRLSVEDNRGESVRYYLTYSIICTIITLVSISQNERLISYFASGLTLYVFGLIFYIKDKNKWFHLVWHLFVLAGSLVHFAGIKTI